MSDESALEQGFNESELADIMDEIEDLEKEFVGGEKAEKKEEKEKKAVETATAATKQEEEQESEVATETETGAETEAEKKEDAVSNEQKEPVMENAEPEQEPVIEAAAPTPAIREDLAIAKTQTPDDKTVIQQAVDQVFENKPEVTPATPTIAPTINNSAKTIECPVVNLSQHKKEMQDLAASSLPSLKQDTKMEFTVVGTMEVNLQFHIGKHHITLCIDPKSGLNIELEHGARFTIPLKND